jgi:hypothetical protein
MSLRSKLFQGDPKLEAAASVDSGHVVPGARGQHVGKIQTALNRVDRARIRIDNIYGPETAGAVLAYKQTRGIINRRYQSTPNNIVGKMTVAALDEELFQLDIDGLGPLEITVVGGRIIPSRVRPAFDPSVKLLSDIKTNGGGGDAKAKVGDAVRKSIAAISVKTSRWPPAITGRVRCAQTGGVSVARCTNNPDPSRDDNPPVHRTAFLSELSQPSNISQFPNDADGGVVPLTQEPHVMRFETFRPGDASIAVTRGDILRLLLVDVRAAALGPVQRPALTKLTAGSNFFSAERNENPEPDPTNFFAGRPVNPKRGGRLINLAGETETPEFEDYQCDLDHSEGRFGFRPFADDFDEPSIFIPGGSASHITMRNTPLTDHFVKVIKRIAQPKCRFTFFGSLSFFDRSKLGGRDLESVIRGDLIRIALELI